MSEPRKVQEYRKALHDVAKSARKSSDSREAGTHQNSERQQALEGKAGKLGLEIQGEESKAAPRPTSRHRPKNP